ncbi:site-specific integrase [Actinocorallia lasiicapitis]
MARQRANGEGTVYKRADGRWEAAGYVTTTDGRSRRVRVYGATRKEAMDKLFGKIAASRRGVPVATDPTVTVAAYVTAWLAGVAVHKLRPTTYATYDRYVRTFIVPGLGHKRLAALTPKDVRAWLQDTALVCQCCARGWDARRDPEARHKTSRPHCCSVGRCCGKRISLGTQRYLRCILSAALAHAVREDELPRNAASAVRLGEVRPSFEPFTASEARAFLKVAKNARLGPLYELALRTGLRRGEVLGLRWSDLDLAAGDLHVRQTLQRDPATGTLVGFAPKTASSRRRIALPAACVTSLKAHRLRQDAERATAGATWQDHDLVFTRPDGRPLDGSSVHRLFGELCAIAGVRRVRFHDLRHSCATLLLEQGVDLVTIKELLGHSQIHVTANVYAHVRPRLQRSAIDAMDAILTDQDDATTT